MQSCMGTLDSLVEACIGPENEERLRARVMTILMCCDLIHLKKRPKAAVAAALAADPWINLFHYEPYLLILM